MFKNNGIENLVNVTYKEWGNGRELRLFKKTKLAKELQNIVKKLNDFGNYFSTGLKSWPNETNVQKNCKIEKEAGQ